jgi:hypothetical protein
MDVFHIDSSNISTTLPDGDLDGSATDEITEVKFEAHSEFDLNFFDTPDDSMTQGAFSNPNSVESSVSLAPTPEPHLPLTPNGISNHNHATVTVTTSNMSINQHNMVNIKNGKSEQ